MHVHSLRFGDFTVDPAAGEMTGPAGREQLDPKVLQVLVVLARNAGEVVPRHELLEKVWPGVVVGDDVVSRCIYQLRRHLKQAGGDDRYSALVETLPKRGYRLNCDVPVPSHDASDTGDTPENRTDAPSRDPAPVPGRSRWKSRRLLAGTAAVLLVAAATGAWLLQRSDYFWQNPFADARFTRMTDFEGVAPGVAVSRDGKLVAFLASRDGQLDAWISQVGTGEFRNLTQGRIPELENASLRSIAFTPDGSRVALWTRFADASGETESIDIWSVPVVGGLPRPYLDDVAEVDWSPDGTRMVYHPAAPGDPLFVTEPNRTTSRQIYIAPRGVHCHFPLWSPDAKFIYFVQGRPPDETDIWRIPVHGGQPERITSHNARVSYPVFLDRRTLLYLATAEDGSGPWLHGVDVERRVVHRIGFGLDHYTSLAASGDGRRVVATRATPRTSLWRVPVTGHMVVESDAQRIPLPAAGGRSPRLGPDYLLFVSPSDGSGIRRLSAGDNLASELWNGGQARIIGGPAIDPATQRIAFSVAEGGRNRLQVMNADGTGVRTLGGNLQVKDAPAWSPDGKWIAVAADQSRGTRLFRVPLDGTPPTPIVDEYSRDAVWSPEGNRLVYNGAEVGPTFPVKAFSMDGRPRPQPNLTLPRGARRVAFLPGTNALVVLKGDARDRNFWLVDLETGTQRQLTAFEPGFAIGDFHVSADGRDIVFDRLREESDVVQIDLALR